MNAHRKRTCPFRLDGRGFVKLAREWPRGKVAKKARIPFNCLPLPGSPRLARFSPDWFSWIVCAVVRFAVAIRSPLPLPPHGGGRTRETSRRLRWRMPRFRTRLWKPGSSIRSLRNWRKRDLQRAGTAESRVWGKIRPVWKRRSHLLAGLRSRRRSRLLVHRPGPLPKRSILPPGATNFQLASTDTVHAARYAHRVTRR